MATSWFPLMLNGLSGFDGGGLKSRDTPSSTVIVSTTSPTLLFSAICTLERASQTVGGRRRDEEQMEQTENRRGRTRRTEAVGDPVGLTGGTTTHHVLYRGREGHMARSPSQSVGCSPLVSHRGTAGGPLTGRFLFCCWV